jgi:hypothetical protein
MTICHVSAVSIQHIVPGARRWLREIMVEMFRASGAACDDRACSEPVDPEREKIPGAISAVDKT